MSPRLLIGFTFFIFTIILLLPFQAYSASCGNVVHELNAQLSPKIDEQELVDAVRTLNKTKNKTLPAKFLTKREAQEQGWRPGRDLWSVPALKGTSIGGDKFNNREGRLPAKKWREADLGYKGGHRGSKRLIFSREGARYVTVDHYRSFMEIPTCQ